MMKGSSDRNSHSAKHDQENTTSLLWGVWLFGLLTFFEYIFVFLYKKNQAKMVDNMSFLVVRVDYLGV